MVDQGVYHYSVSGPNVLLAHAVDLEVIKQRSHGPSESTSIESREEFRTRILARDGFCVWTGFEMPVAMHIIPHRRGDEVCMFTVLGLGMRAKYGILLQWLRSIIDNRPHDENLSTLTSVDNIRNGICAIAGLHDELFDPRKVVVLKVCPPFSSERSPLNTMHVRRRILSSEPPTFQIGTSAIYLRRLVTQPNPAILSNGSLLQMKTIFVYSQTTTTLHSRTSDCASLQTSYCTTITALQLRSNGGRITEL